MKHLASRTPDILRGRGTAIAISVLVLAVFLASLVAVANSLSDRIEQGDSDRSTLAAEVKEKDAQLDDQQAKTALAVDQLRRNGIKPSVDASIPSAPTAAPTPAELMDYARRALADFCSDGRCTPEGGQDGKDGRDGETGAPGADSTVPGPAGPAGPAGADGKDGKDGADGKDGRGIESTRCTDDGWIVTYTDGSSENAGRCRSSGPLGTE